MNLSTEPSIETLPDYANGTNVVDMNVINDQTIANYCSDNVRELNNLTEELQQSDLDEIGVPLHHHNHENQNSFNVSDRLNDDRLRLDANDGIQDSVHKTSVHSPFEENLQSTSENGQNNLISDHNLMVSYYNRTMFNGQSNDSTENTNCDDVDSSPYYTHYNAHFENHSDEDDKCKSRISINNSHHNQNGTHPYANGRLSADGSKDSDPYRMPLCMLQSVDLRGKYRTA